jgi:hypothetical protein
LDPPSIAALALVNRSIHEQLFGSGCHLWKELTLRRYDPVRDTDDVDWQRLYQSRNWVEKLLMDHTLSATRAMMEKRDTAMPEWKVAGTDILLVVRDMIMENGVSTVGTMRANLITVSRNESLLHPSSLVQSFRTENEYSTFAAVMTLFLSPLAKFNAQLSQPAFSPAQRAVYIPTTNPLFDDRRTPNFQLLLYILKFFQHHLEHIRQHIGFATRQAMSWHSSGPSSLEAFQPGPRVQRKDFDNDPSLLEGDWIGLYSYLGWADFEALRDGNPAVLEANRCGQLRDYIGGPQQLTIRVPKEEGHYSTKETSDGNVSIDITGDGVNGGPFIFRGKLRRVFLPGSLFGGDDKYLYWRITFIKTYANGENSWTRWIYDGIFVPGKAFLY